jgi:FHA domain
MQFANVSLMWEGNTGGEECVSTLARFVPGTGRLFLLPAGRFVFVANGHAAFDFSDGFSGLATNRDFFLGCIERWFSAGSKPDLVAGVIGLQSTAVLAIGRQPVQVETTSGAGLVDPSLASFAAEQVFAGALVSISVGDLVAASDGQQAVTPCWATHGLLPAEAFVLSPSTLSLPTVSVQVSALVSSPLAVQRTVASEAAAPSPEPDARAPEFAPAPEARNDSSSIPAVPAPFEMGEVLQASIAPAHPASFIVSAPINKISAYDNFDEVLDGATVWPTAGRRSSFAHSASSAIVAPSSTGAAVESLESEQSAQDLGGTTPVVSDDLSKTGVVEAGAKLAQADSGTDSWEPPAPEPFLSGSSVPIVGSPSVLNQMPPASVDSEGAQPYSGMPTAQATSGMAETVASTHASETVSWSPVSKATQIVEPDSTELTIMAGDLARIRKTFVAVADSGNEAPIGTVMGVYCRGGHFTDSRKPRCLFCQEETDFDTMTSATPPLLGVLAFDDNRVTPVTGLVLVGRKPSTNDPSATAVAFGEDMMLSRVHFEVRLFDWDVSVVDKQSANGTQIEHLDGRRIAARPNIEVRLEPGSIVRFGNHQATFRRS